MFIPISNRGVGGEEANFKALFRKYQTSAAKRGHAFELSISRFRELVTQPCFICGQEPSGKYKHDKRQAYAVAFTYTGIDRMDNSLGYVEGNVAPCCRECNYAKGKRSLADLLLYIYRAYKHAVEPALNEGVPDVLSCTTEPDAERSEHD